MKLLISVILFTMTTKSFAQTFQIKYGLNLSKMFAKDDDGTYNDNDKFKPGFHLGATAEFSKNYIISFETGLLLSTKGFKVREKGIFFGQTFDYKRTVNVYYIDIPLNAKASFKVGAAKIYGVFGPYLGIGLVGKDKRNNNVDGIDHFTVSNIPWGTDKENDYFKRLDFGLIAGAGVEINSTQIGFSYGFGLANISPATEKNYKINNRVLGISIGYKFTRKSITSP